MRRWVNFKRSLIVLRLRSSLELQGISVKEATRLALMSLAAPIGLLLAAVAVTRTVEPGAIMYLGVLAYTPDVLAGLGILLAWRFHRSRVVFALVGVLITSRVLAVIPQGGGVGEDVYGQIVYASLVALLPINLVAFALLGEKGVLTTRGLLRFGLIAVQVLTVAFIAVGENAGPSTIQLRQFVGQVLHLRLIPADFDVWTYLTQPGLMLFSLGFAVLLGKALLDRHILNDGLLGALAALAAALHFVGRGPASTAFLGAAAGILLLALILDSYNMAFCDELTGLPGRRALMAELQKLGSTYTLAMLDVDHFKKFNDTHGHDVGDQVLRMVAHALRGVRGGGRAFRYGGEEFTIVFAGKSAREALPFLEEVREAVAAAGFTLRDKKRPADKPREIAAKSDAPSKRISVTISIGASERTAKAPDPSQVMKKADQALYRAKDGGRNKVVADAA